MPANGIPAGTVKSAPGQSGRTTCLVGSALIAATCRRGSWRQSAASATRTTHATWCGGARPATPRPACANTALACTTTPTSRVQHLGGDDEATSYLRAVGACVRGTGAGREL